MADRNIYKYCIRIWPSSSFYPSVSLVLHRTEGRKTAVFTIDPGRGAVYCFPSPLVGDANTRGIRSAVGCVFHSPSNIIGTLAVRLCKTIKRILYQRKMWKIVALPHPAPVDALPCKDFLFLIPYLPIFAYEGRCCYFVSHKSVVVLKDTLSWMPKVVETYSLGMQP